MIRCRVCDREHEPTAKICACGADLAVDGIAVGLDARFGDADLGDSLPDLGDLPDLATGPADFPAESSLTDSLSIPDAETTPPAPVSPAPVPASEPAPPMPTPPRPDARRDFAVQPTAGSGDPHKGEVRSAPTPSDVGPSVIAPVPTAPVVDESLDSSVFTEEEGYGEWEGGTGMREELRRDRAGGTIECPSCGSVAAADRSFCRCGHQLEARVRTPMEPEHEPPKLTSFWRRLTGTARGSGGDQRSWGQRAKDTGARRGMRYATRLSGRTRLGRMGLMLAGGAGLLLVLGPLRQQVRDLPELFEASAPQQVEARGTGSCDGPAFDVPGNPWQTRWPEGTPVADDTECPGVFGTISGSFANGVDIDRMTIEIGDTSGQSDFNRRQPVMSPAMITIEFDHEGREPTIIELDLEDTSALQEFSTKARGATTFTLRILDVHSHSWQELELAQIAQIAFFSD